MAACANLQSSSAFWAVHDFLFENQRSLNPDTLGQEVKSALSKTGISGFDPRQFDACLRTGKGASDVQEDLMFARAHEVRATPTLFINGRRFEGLQKADELRREIDSIAAERNQVAKR